MSLNSSSASAASALPLHCCAGGQRMFVSEMPSAKLSFNINAFNGNTTNFNRRPSPSSKSISASTVLPIQPHESPFGFYKTQLPQVGLIRPM